MSGEWIGFVGVLIGSAVSFCGVYWQMRLERRRELGRLAIELAIHEHRMQLEDARRQEDEDGVGPTVHPPITYLFFNHEMAKLITKNSFTVKDVARVYERRDHFAAAVRALGAKF